MAEISLNEAIGKITKLDAAISSALSLEVAEAVRGAVRDAAESEVYQAYEPLFESRRRENGGLTDPDNTVVTVAGTTLMAENVTGLQNLWGGGDSSPLAPIIEDGVEAYHMPFPRPFMAYAQELLENGRAQEALRRGLARQGIDVDGVNFIID